MPGKPVISNVARILTTPGRLRTSSVRLPLPRMLRTLTWPGRLVTFDLEDQCSL